MREIYAAEGSDWFWWYGPDFSTDCDGLFDELFRQHLKNVYALCGDMPPAVLDRPIIGNTIPPLYTRPRRLISPAIDGSPSPFYNWAGAGSYTAGSEQGAMFRDDRFIQTIRYGFDESQMYIRVDLRRWGQFRIALTFHQPAGVVILTPQLSPGLRGELTRTERGTERPIGTLATGEIVELSIPFKDLGIAAGSILQFQLKLFHNGIERECYPETAPIELTVPDAETRMAQWAI